MLTGKLTIYLTRQLEITANHLANTTSQESIEICKARAQKGYGGGG